jgi:hypothetical protein
MPTPPVLSDVGYTPGAGAEIAVDTGSIPGSVVPVSDLVVDGLVVSALNGVSLPVNTEATSLSINGQTVLTVRDESILDAAQRTAAAVEAMLDLQNAASTVPFVLAGAPVGPEQGLVTRNIPSGVQSVSVTDGTHGPVNVTAASTAAVATQLAQVVALHPSSPLPTGANTIGIANQGTAATLANAWSAKITDATNGPAAVKPTKTAALVTDPALVVAISPNSPAPQGGYDINGNLVTASLVTQNGTVQERVYDETNRLLLEQILLVLADIRTTLMASELKGEAVSISTSLDANN